MQQKIIQNIQHTQHLHHRNHQPDRFLSGNFRQSINSLHHSINDTTTDDGVFGAHHDGRDSFPPTKADGIGLLRKTEQSTLHNLDAGFVRVLVQTILDVFGEALLLVVGADQKDVAATSLEGLGHDELEETGPDDQDLLGHLSVGGTHAETGG